MIATAVQHNEYLERLKEHLETHFDIVVKPNCRYDPVNRRIILKGKRDSWYEYDLIGFRKSSTGVNQKYPVLFLEYTHLRYFSRQKYIYEAWRWHWFCQALIKSGAIPEALEDGVDASARRRRRVLRDEKTRYDPPPGPPLKNLPYGPDLVAPREISDACSRRSAVPLLAVWWARTASMRSTGLGSHEFLPVINIQTVSPADLESRFDIPHEPHRSIYGD